MTTIYPPGWLGVESVNYLQSVKKAHTRTYVVSRGADLSDRDGGGVSGYCGQSVVAELEGLREGSNHLLARGAVPGTLTAPVLHRHRAHHAVATYALVVGKKEETY